LARRTDEIGGADKKAIGVCLNVQDDDVFVDPGQMHALGEIDLGFNRHAVLQA